MNEINKLRYKAFILYVGRVLSKYNNKYYSKPSYYVDIAFKGQRFESCP